VSAARFPVIRGQSRAARELREKWPRDVPWSFVETFREQAEANHSQTLERLAQRGGLCPSEMWLAAHGQPLSRFRRNAEPPSEEACGQWLIDEMRKLGEDL
jgi:hypothetical protein